MKVRILSDLHQEFAPAALPAQDVDLILLAGDIHTKQNALPWIREFTGQTPAVYVCGNHEFYGDNYPRVIERLQEQTVGSNIHVLENDFIQIGKWRIFGCTLWTDMELVSDWQDGCAEAESQMNDYRRIRNSKRNYRKLRAIDTRRAHLESVWLLESFLKKSDPKHSIILTHHAPSVLSLPKSRWKEPISCAYASRLDPFIKQWQPALWVHGHIHHNNDYYINKTRVLANPQAYPDAPNPHFIPDLIVDLPD